MFWLSQLWGVLLASSKRLLEGQGLLLNNATTKNHELRSIKKCQKCRCLDKPVCAGIVKPEMTEFFTKSWRTSSHIPILFSFTYPPVSLRGFSDPSTTYSTSLSFTNSVLSFCFHSSICSFPFTSVTSTQLWPGITLCSSHDCSCLQFLCSIPQWLPCRWAVLKFSSDVPFCPNRY